MADLAEFGKWLERKGVRFECQSCGKSDWAAEVEPTMRDVLREVAIPAAQPVHRGLMTPLSAHVNCYVLTCSNCGFMRFYNSNTYDPHEQ